MMPTPTEPLIPRAAVDLLMDMAADPRAGDDRKATKLEAGVQKALGEAAAILDSDRARGKHSEIIAASLESTLQLQRLVRAAAHFRARVCCALIMDADEKAQPA